MTMKLTKTRMKLSEMSAESENNNPAAKNDADDEELSKIPKIKKAINSPNKMNQ